MMSDQIARDSWKAADDSAPLPSLDELRVRADGFRRVIRRRNLVEYAAGILVVVMFAMGALTAPLLALRMGSALVAGGACVVMWQLYWRGRPLSPPEHGGRMSVLEFQRRELARQRDALDSIFTWYLLPLIPGMAVIMAAPLLSLPPDAWRMPPADALFVMAAVVGVFVAVYLLNKWGARRLQRQIDEIDALMAE